MPYGMDLQPRPRNTIWVVGDIFMDVQVTLPKNPKTNSCELPSKWGTDTISPGIELLPGGSAANTARHMNALLETDAASDVRFVSAVGDDLSGKAFLETMKKENMNTEYIETVPGKLTSTCVVLSAETVGSSTSGTSSTDTKDENSAPDRSFISSHSSTSEVRSSSENIKRMFAEIAESLKKQAVKKGAKPNERLPRKRHILCLFGLFNLPNVQTEELVAKIQELKELEEKANL
jgi:sugar/nucleoside kinase (ribokinase family)